MKDKTPIKFERVVTPTVRPANWWFAVLTGIRPKQFAATRRGNMFAPRSPKHPV